MDSGSTPSGASPRSRFAPLLVAVLAVVLFLPALRWLVSEWLGNDYYSHGLLVPFISAFLAWRLWVTWPSQQRRLEPATPGLILLAAALALYLYALLQRAYFVASLAMIALIAGLIWYLLGIAVLRRLAFPLAFLLFMVPLPFVEPLSIPLAQFTGVIAASVIRLFGTPIIISGSAVTLPSANLVVGAQCSGMRSIITLFTLVALVVYLMKGPWWGTLVLALSSVPIAILGNVLRVSSLLAVADTWGADAGFEYYHNYSGILFFASALVLLLLVSRWVGCRDIRDDIL